MRAIFLPIVLGALVTSTGARSLEVFGYAGVLGEWELTAVITETASQQTGEFSGSVTMTHIGLCRQDRPEEKTGEIRLQVSGSPARLTATILVAGVMCRYSGRMADFYSGMMICPDRESVPLKLWLK